MKPILKWVGGKAQLLEIIKENMPETFDTYFEPFIGGGAIFFNVEPQKALINDLNTDLINVYKVIKKKPKDLIDLLETHKNKHNKDYYYTIRALDRDNTYSDLTDVEKAARVIYLNKTCYNGLYRVNKKGEFNVPLGSYTNPRICDEANITEVSRFFNKRKIKVFNEDFAKFLKKVKDNDFIYLDPPYDPTSDSSDFTNYQKEGFSKEDQIRLKKTCDEMNEKGAKFMLSNSCTPFICELYKDYHIKKVWAKRNVNSKGNKRGPVEEVLIMNYRK